MQLRPTGTQGYVFVAVRLKNLPNSFKHWAFFEPIDSNDNAGNNVNLGNSPSVTVLVWLDDG